MLLLAPGRQVRIDERNRGAGEFGLGRWLA